MSYAILIPARKSSSRMSGKNFLSFNGQPLIDKTIEFAHKFEFPIYVSTDWHDYKFKKPVILIKRPAVLARDDTDMRLVVEHAAEKIREDVIILLQPTSPLREEELVRYCIRKYEDEHGNFNVITVYGHTYKPSGGCFVFPKHRYIWDHPVWLVWDDLHDIDIDYIWDFRIAEAQENGSHS